MTSTHHVAFVEQKNNKWEESISLSKQDKLFKDAIETAAISGKSDVVEELVRYVSACFQMFVWAMADLSLVCRHRQQGVLRGHALRLLRPHPP